MKYHVAIPIIKLANDAGMLNFSCMNLGPKAAVPLTIRPSAHVLKARKENVGFCI